MKTNPSIVTLALLAAFVSCKPDALQPDQPAKEAQALATSPVKSTQDKDLISVFKKTKISWADTDYQEAEYDASSTPIRYIRQNLYVQGTNQVRKVVYDFIRNTDGQLTRVNASNGSYVLYNYKDDQVSGTNEFSSAGKLISTRTYLYFLDNRLKRISETPGDGTRGSETTKTFSYDAKGNLSQVIDATKNAQTGAYRIDWITRYSGYDTHKNVSNLWTLYPFLPRVTLQVNNPATIATYMAGPDGTEKLLNKIDYAFRYNEQDYPVSHTETRPGGKLMATYSYLGQ